MAAATEDYDDLDYENDEYEDEDDEYGIEAAAAATAAAVAAAGPSQQDLTFKKLYNSHPECILDYIETVVPRIPLTVAPAGPGQGDPNHVTYPFLTKFEMTKIIGHRANELSLGAFPYIPVPEHITDVREIARLELAQKRLPYVIKRPLPTGKYEYWRLADLIILPA
jgi:DNA-directed RNA polymerase I, II, and III subunit RPABC2